jgi:hypothetical protein
MNIIPILAETISWPGAMVVSVAIVGAIIFLGICMTGKWPWEK